MENIPKLTPGKLESPEKLCVFYAGYTAMRSIWGVKKKEVDPFGGDKLLAQKFNEELPGSLIFRANKEISHSIGEHSKTLLRVTTFKYWGKIVLKLWG